MTRALVEELISAPDLLGSTSRRCAASATRPCRRRAKRCSAEGDRPRQAGDGCRRHPDPAGGGQAPRARRAPGLGVPLPRVRRRHLDRCRRGAAPDARAGGLRIAVPATAGGRVPARASSPRRRRRAARRRVRGRAPPAGSRGQMRAWSSQFDGDLSGTAADRVAVELLDAVPPAYLHLDMAPPPVTGAAEAATAAGATATATRVDAAADLVAPVNSAPPGPAAPWSDSPERGRTIVAAPDDVPARVARLGEPPTTRRRSRRATRSGFRPARGNRRVRQSSRRREAAS